MALDLGDFEKRAKDAVKLFWAARTAAIEKQQAKGKADQGQRGAVTGGKNMDGFLQIIDAVVRNNGLPDATIHVRGQPCLTLPGYFRPSKMWDVVVLNGSRLIAALELKSQVGSISNNFNNRSEEVIGMGHDFWTAFREGAFPDQDRPFLGWLMLFEDQDADDKRVRSYCQHFPVFPIFEGSSYSKRYEILCRRLVSEGLFDQASLILSPQILGAAEGKYRELSEATGLRPFLAGLAGHCAAEGAKLAPKQNDR